MLGGVVIFLFAFATEAGGQAVPQTQAGSSGPGSQQLANPGATQSVPEPDGQEKSRLHRDRCGDPDVNCLQQNTDNEGKQTKRMFWVVPNFTAVSANTQLPPESPRQKFGTALDDSVDYSSFVWAGIIAGQGMALKNYPELHQGLAGYGRYYWRAFADQASGAMFTEAIVPTLTHEDPRYYTLGHGGFFKRAGYALSQLVVTRKDTPGLGFNISEVGGNAIVAGLSNAYYPPEERGFNKTVVNWATQMESAGLNNIVKEFWPDIRRKLFRQK